MVQQLGGHRGPVLRPGMRGREPRIEERAGHRRETIGWRQQVMSQGNDSIRITRPVVIDNHARSRPHSELTELGHTTPPPGFPSLAT